MSQVQDWSQSGIRALMSHFARKTITLSSRYSAVAFPVDSIWSDSIAAENANG
jgi:hypothetical protein